MKRLLFVGDAGCPSGFARATHEILDRVRFEYDVTVLGMNYRGDPHDHPYPIYAAAAGGDSLGVGRLIWMCDLVQPDVIVIQQDGWFIPYYIKKLRERAATGEYKYPQHAAVPVVASLAVDGKHFQGAWIQDVSLAIFWTQFGLSEARIGGYAGQAKVIPLGVDLDTFHPVVRDGALERQKATALRGKFIVGNVNRNQPRKRWDLTVKYFAEWVHSRQIQDAMLFLHSAPTGDESVNVLQLAKYYGIIDKLALCQPETFYGNLDEDVCDTYNCFDVDITTTQGEGMGLTTLEAMACGVPCIVPEWAALGDWAKGAAEMVPCTSTALQSPGLSVIGGVADELKFVEALDRLYRNRARLSALGEAGLKRVQEPCYRWQAIGEEWIKALDALLAPPEAVDDELWQEVTG